MLFLAVILFLNFLLGMPPETHYRCAYERTVFALMNVVYHGDLCLP